MTAVVTARLGFSYGYDVGESGWKPGVDKNFQLSATMTGLWVINDALTAPPGGPSDGDTYIVATGGTGAWSGHDAAVAAYMNAAWFFFAPTKGLRGWFAAASEFRRYTGSAWVAEVTSRNKGAMLAQWVAGAVVRDDTIYFAYKTPYAGTVDSLDYFTGNDSFSVAVKIDGTNVTGLAAVAVSSATPANAVATAAKTFAAGDTISGVISGTTGVPTDAVLNLNVTWT